MIVKLPGFQGESESIHPNYPTRRECCDEHDKETAGASPTDVLCIRSLQEEIIFKHAINERLG